MSQTNLPRRLFLLLSLTVSAGACAVRPPVQIRAVQPASDSIRRLQSDLEQIFADSNFASAQWGVEVLSLDRGELLFEHNPICLYMPASNNKILTSAAALVRLGPEYRFETGVWMGGGISEGILKGDLLITGAGDPSIAARFHAGDPFAVFKEWAAHLKEKGIGRIEGELIGADLAFDPKTLGRGWNWDDLAYGYAAPVTSLQFNENLMTAVITPADTVGKAASVRVAPLTDYMAVDCRVLTGPPGSESTIEIRRAEVGESIVLLGSVPLGGEAVTQRIAVRDPTLFFMRALKQTLQAEGVDVSGCLIKKAPRSENFTTGLTLLFPHRSVPLASILNPLLKVSQNLYAETMSRALAIAAGREGSFKDGRDIVEETLGGMAIQRGTYLYADGSGLSRLNLVSADLLVRIFRFMYRHRYFSQFYDSLPIAGVDGTIAERMKGTRAENNARAKTGSLAGVRSLSGYVRTADGEMLAFAMIANNFLASTKAAEYVQDAAVERLANFTRRTN